MGAGRPAAASQTATHVIDTSTSSSTAREIATARRADSVAFLHRAPFALDAYELGFLPGFREDCGYQQSQSTQLDIPVGMLDNDFRNPDLERFVDRFFEHEPQVGVIGDVYERDDINDHVAAAREIQASYPEAELIIVPKSRTVIDAIPEDLVLGYSRGYADRLAHEFSDPPDWRGRRIHPRREPTQATRGYPPADPTDAFCRSSGRHRRRRLEWLASRRTVR